MSDKQSVFAHLREQPFIVATGVAAFAHSTWTLGTWFAGMQPIVTANLLEGGLNGEWVAQSLRLVFWLLPAALIAAALDIGQIATSRDIQRGQRTFAKYATFGVFAVATYYLQWLYLAHHMPVVDLSIGIRSEMLEFAKWMRDVSIWLIPLLLPLSTLLYTFSHAAHAEQATHLATVISATPKQDDQPMILVKPYTSRIVHLPPPPPERNYSFLLEPDRHAFIKPTASKSPASKPIANKSNGGGGNATGEIDASLSQIEGGLWQTSCICGKHFENETALGAKRAASGHQAKCTVYKQMQIDNTERRAVGERGNAGAEAEVSA